MSYDHGGDIYRNQVELDLSVCVSPLGMPEGARAAAEAALRDCGAYPDTECGALREAIASFWAEECGKCGRRPEMVRPETVRPETVPSEMIRPEMILPGNGAAELIHAAVRALRPAEVIVPEPGFSEYEAAARAVGAAVTKLRLREEEGFRWTKARQQELLGMLRENSGRVESGVSAESGVSVESGEDGSQEARSLSGRMLFLCEPNNPTGGSIGRKWLEEILEACGSSGTWICLDECFLPFAGDPAGGTMLPFCRQYPRLLILRAFTKIYAMAGLRLGYLVTGSDEVRERIRRQMQPWNVSIPAQAAGVAALRDREYPRRVRALMEKEKARLLEALSSEPALLCRVYGSDANFIFFSAPAGQKERLLEQKVLIREFRLAGQEGQQSGRGFYRIGIRTKEENDEFLRRWRMTTTATSEATASAPFGEKQAAGTTAEASATNSLEMRSAAMPRRARPIMVAGTMSDAGKSLVAAGLCRIFTDEGYRTVPFKAQNMALNSFITKDGLEMGRSQVVQAEACRREPDARMNPILLKPTTDMGSQVIVLGKPAANMHASEYYRRKGEFRPVVREAYESLAAENDVVVLEGAGSSAEINLMENDLVNMGMAAMADAPVLLVGNIDPGGVFAQLYGTVALLPSADRARIRGLIINKFRGDPAILEPGLSMLEERTGIPVLGVIPYMDVRLEPEDSLWLDSRSTDGQELPDLPAAPIDIAVLRFPRISNFTDFEALSLEPGVRLRYISEPAELGCPDAIILPGTKSTIADYRWMRETGLEDAVLEAHRRGSFLVGICGGYQMMGTRILDPGGAECRGSSPGMGLLDMVTVFTEEKQMRQLSAVSAFGIPALDGRRITGYEVHMGRSEEPGTGLGSVEAAEAGPAGAGTDPAADGGPEMRAGDALIGTYLHGLFDEDGFRAAFIEYLMERRNSGAEVGPDSNVGPGRSADADIGGPAGQAGTKRRPGLNYKAFKEAQLDKVADQLRRSLDLDAIRRIMGLDR